jgi:hypothetical protein
VQPVETRDMGRNGMQWQNNIIIIAVYASSESKNAWIYFRNALGVVGWRRILPTSADGCTNTLIVATEAIRRGRPIQCLVTNAGEIAAIQSL